MRTILTDIKDGETGLEETDCNQSVHKILSIYNLKNVNKVINSED